MYHNVFNTTRFIHLLEITRFGRTQSISANSTSSKG
jgi:hypothetical protein